MTHARKNVAIKVTREGINRSSSTLSIIALVKLEELKNMQAFNMTACKVSVTL